MQLVSLDLASKRPPMPQLERWLVPLGVALLLAATPAVAQNKAQAEPLPETTTEAEKPAPAAQEQTLPAAAKAPPGVESEVDPGKTAATEATDADQQKSAATAKHKRPDRQAGTAKARLAVMDVKVNAEDLDPVVGESISAVLAAEISARAGPGVHVISRGDLRAILGQQVDAQQLGCSDPKCLVDLGQVAAADQMVTSSIGKVGEEWVFALELIDVAVGQVTARQAVSWKGRPAGLVELVRPYVARLLVGAQAEEYAGALELLANEQEANVHLNDKEVGATPVTRIEDLPIGKHRVRVNKEGFLAYETDVVVNRNETTLLQVNLIDEASLEPWYYKWWVWAAAGGIVAGVVTAAVLLQPEETTTLTVQTNLP